MYITRILNKKWVTQTYLPFLILSTRAKSTSEENIYPHINGINITIMSIHSRQIYMASGPNRSQ